MANELTQPKKGAFNIGNLRSGLNDVGSGGGGGGVGMFLDIPHKTGGCFVGREKVPYSTEWRTAVRVDTIRYGYYVFKGKGGGAPDKTNMVAMITGAPKPTPDVPYAAYPEPGPRDITEVVLSPMEGPLKGTPVEFAPTSVSSQNRIGDLIDAIVRQSELPGGQAGFVHPVIKVKTDYWTGDYGDIHHFSYDLVDWLDDSGTMLQSQWEGTPQVGDGSETEQDGGTGAEDEEYDFLKG